MKKNLLLTTALVALSMPAYAGLGLDNNANLEYNVDSDLYTTIADATVGSYSGYDASANKEASVVFATGTTLTISPDSIIQNNKAQVGGAVAVSGKNPAVLDIGAGTQFIGNTAIYDGGAIGNYGGAIVAENVEFVGNKAQLNAANDSRHIGGGAISLGVDATLDVTDGYFSGNESHFNGGAIATRRTLEEGEYGVSTENHYMKITGSTFIGNKALDTYVDIVDSTNNYKDKGGNGGAISNYFNTAVITGSTFEGNYAKNSGGAIHNAPLYDYSTHAKRYDTGNISIDSSTFKDNIADYQGGAILSAIGASVTLTGEEKQNEFKNNHAYYDGGAIASFGELSISNSLFEGNTAHYTGNQYSEIVSDGLPIGGGAIALGAVSDTNIASITNTKFKDNKSGTNGGAIGTRLGSDADNSQAELNIDATFTGNYAHNNGGAIYNTFYAGEKGVTVKGSFVENTAGGDGGAIYNDGEKDKAGNNGGKMTILSGSEFKDNRAEGFGGAIRNRLGDLTIEDGVTFSGNEAYTGGAITSGSSKNLIVDTITIGSAIFDGNHASADAGAVGVYRKGVLTGTVFKNNTAGIKIAGVEASNESDGGGAFMLGGTANATLNNVTFEKNQASGRGGAISARQDAGYTLTVQEKSKFVENSAGTYGGAIVNVYAGTVNVTNVDFEKNSAGKSGGAIYNGEAINYGSSSEGIMSTDHGIINISGANNFTNNTAKELGGAIYNDDGGTLNLEGTNVFSGNTAGGKANDIHNTGTLNVAGNLTLDGGITGTGTVVFNNATLKATLDKTTIAANSVEINNSTLDLILGDNVTIGKHDFITVKDTEEKKANLTGVFTINNTLYNISHLETGEINVETKSADEITSNFDASATEANALIAAVSGTSNNQYFNDVANTLSAAAQNGDATAVKEAGKLGADVNPIVSSQETGTHEVLFSVVNGELNGESGAMAGMSSGDVFKKVSAWVRGLFNKADHESTSKASGFSADTYGVAMGIDSEVNANTRLGFGYANSQTDIESAGRDTDVDTNSLFVYSQYKPANWYINTVLAYSWSEYDESKSVVGYAASAKYDVDTIALQSMYGYETKFRAYDVTPEFGFRYLHIDQDAYTDKLGTNVSENSEDVLTLVAGAKIAKNYKLDNGAILRPELKAAVTYDLFDSDNSANVMLANGASYTVDGEKLNRLGFEFGAKVTTNATDKVEVSAGYLTRVREDYQDHTVTLDARYNF